jgi:hypothetical protein
VRENTCTIGNGGDRTAWPGFECGQGFLWTLMYGSGLGTVRAGHQLLHLLSRSLTPSCNLSLVQNKRVRCTFDNRSHAHAHPHPHPHTHTHAHIHTHMDMAEVATFCQLELLLTGLSLCLRHVVCWPAGRFPIGARGQLYVSGGLPSAPPCADGGPLPVRSHSTRETLLGCSTVKTALFSFRFLSDWSTSLADHAHKSSQCGWHTRVQVQLPTRVWRTLASEVFGRLQVRPRGGR